MNRTYRSLWNPALGAWVAAPENARARGKCSSSSASRIARACIVVLALGAATTAHAQARSLGGLEGGEGGGATGSPPGGSSAVPDASGGSSDLSGDGGGGGGATSFGSGAITNNAALFIDQSGDASLDLPRRQRLFDQDRHRHCRADADGDQHLRRRHHRRRGALSISADQNLGAALAR
ncbi:hypothetical protein GXN78_21040 [Variovorax sp. WS11]|nr:hypothetical protein [Variovorax sp. WS11]